MNKLPLLAIAILLTSSCTDKAKHKLGLADTGPDEYQVSRSKSLEVPPFYKKFVDDQAQEQKEQMEKEQQ